MVGGPGPALSQQPLGADLGPVLHREVGRHRHRLRARVLHVDLEVVLEVLAHPRQVADHVDAQGAQLARRADARELQELRRVDRPAAEDHLIGLGRPGAPARPRVLDSNRPRAVEQHARGQRERLHGQVGTVHHRMQVGLRSRQALAVVDVAIEGGKALLPIAVDVRGQRMAGLLYGGEERVKKRTASRTALEHERAVVTAEGIVALGGQAVLHALEVGQAMGVVPRLHPLARGPALVVQRVAALEDHAVDAARSAQDLPARVVDAAAAHVWLGLRLVLPVVEAVADREGQRRGHVDEHIPRPVRAPCLQDQDTVARIRGEAIGEHAARGAAADDYVVVPGVHTCASSPFSGSPSTIERNQ